MITPSVAYVSRKNVYCLKVGRTLSFYCFLLSSNAYLQRNRADLLVLLSSLKSATWWFLHVLFCDRSVSANLMKEENRDMIQQFHYNRTHWEIRLFCRPLFFHGDSTIVLLILQVRTVATKVENCAKVRDCRFKYLPLSVPSSLLST